LALPTLCWMGTHVLLPQKWGRAANWEVGLDPSNIVLDRDPACPPPKRRQSPQFSAHVYCGQTAGWIKTPLGMDVDLGLGHIVLDGEYLVIYYGI